MQCVTACSYLLFRLTQAPLGGFAERGKGIQGLESVAEAKAGEPGQRRSLVPVSLERPRVGPDAPMQAQSQVGADLVPLEPELRALVKTELFRVLVPVELQYDRGRPAESDAALDVYPQALRGL